MGGVSQSESFKKIPLGLAFSGLSMLKKKAKLDLYRLAFSGLSMLKKKAKLDLSVNC